MNGVPGKLEVGKDGKLRGPASFAYNDPWPCVNHGVGSGAMNGVVQHTMVGNLPGTITVFNDPKYEASAFFGVDQSGHIHQFIGVGLGLYSWAQEAGNVSWYSIEFADDGNTHNPLTEAQIRAGAQLVECLSAFAGFPLQEANSPDGRGLGVHVMGGAAWGGHTCPGPGPRAGQRAAIIELAKQIRHQQETKTVTWQAKALTQAKALGDDLTALVALLQPGDAQTKAQAIQAEAAALADLIGHNQ